MDLSGVIDRFGVAVGINVISGVFDIIVETVDISDNDAEPLG